jgi:predicted CxxxxCH...CXXCH cytochrome family protein
LNSLRNGWKSLHALLLISVIISSAGAAEAAIKCYDCHGTRSSQDYRPLDAPFRNITTGGFQGNHRNHMAFPGSQSSCAVCHPGSEGYTISHRDGKISLASKINGSPDTTTYANSTSSFQQTSNRTNQQLGRCSNVNCHFEKETPVWGSAAIPRNDCTVCHLSPPGDGSHGKKHGEYYGNDTNSCSRCHPDHTTEGNPVSHAMNAGKGPLAVQFSGVNAFGRYSGKLKYPEYLPSQNPIRNGTCLNLYCHSDGLGRAARTIPRWSGQETTKC